jgi:hypothetical protein
MFTLKKLVELDHENKVSAESLELVVLDLVEGFLLILDRVDYF